MTKRLWSAASSKLLSCRLSIVEILQADSPCNCMTCQVHWHAAQSLSFSPSLQGPADCCKACQQTMSFLTDLWRIILDHGGPGAPFVASASKLANFTAFGPLHMHLDRIGKLRFCKAEYSNSVPQSTGDDMISIWPQAWPAYSGNV